MMWPWRRPPLLAVVWMAIAAIITALVAANIHQALQGIADTTVPSLLTLASTSPHPMIDDVGAATTRTKNQTTTTTTTTTRLTMQQQEQQLELVTARYYVYNHPNLTLPALRQSALHNTPRTWPWRTNQRFATYAQGEIRILQALEQDAVLRTFNASQAAFFVLPIPWGATWFWGTRRKCPKCMGRVDRQEALKYFLQHNDDDNTTMSQQWFRQFPHKHVIISVTEHMFTDYWGVGKELRQAMSSVTAIKDMDFTTWQAYTTHQAPAWTCAQIGRLDDESIQRTISIGWAHEASIPTLPLFPLFLANISLAQWQAQKPIDFFYHTTKEPSRCESTSFRQALVKEEDDDTSDNHAVFSSEWSNDYSSTSSIGFDIPAAQWRHDLTHAKYCLVIRGDTPGSRALFRAIRAGCLPVIVSDALEAYAPLFRSWLRLEDFALRVPEHDFARHARDALVRAVHGVSPRVWEQKLQGLALIQRIVVLDHPSPSLFVPALVRELLASQEDPKYFGPSGTIS